MTTLPNLPPRPKHKKSGVTFSPLGIFFLVFFISTLIGSLGWILWKETQGTPLLNFATETDTLTEPTVALLEASETVSPTETIALSDAVTNQESTQTPVVIIITATPNPETPVEIDPDTLLPGMAILAIKDFGYSHIFAYHPENLPLTRLTTGDWDDMHPAASPDGTKIAFTSHRGGQWDIYILDLISGKTSQITNDLAYDGHPAWNPEGTWLAFEKYTSTSLEIFIQPIDQSAPPIQVTVNAMADFAPTWSPDGKFLAFTSNETGSNDIWVAEIEKLGTPNYSRNITANPDKDQTMPVWAPNDNTVLAWIESGEGYPSIYTGTPFEDQLNASYIGSGNLVSWSSDGEVMLAALFSPDQDLISFYSSENNNYLYPPVDLHRQITGISWSKNGLPAQLPDEIKNAIELNPQTSWALQLTPNAGSIYGRQFTIDLPDVIAPYPKLNAQVIEPFLTFRERVFTETGWDVLSDLESAFVPLTQPLSPGYDIDWLYTGRAFSLNRNLIRLGWMHVVREDFGNQTYWRVYLKTRYQDGSQGQPIHQIPWDFNARFTGNTTHYEEGGAPYPRIPEGYWIDFTALAQAYGWERQPALSNWQSYYQGAHFNVFAITNGLDWETAMLQLYPPEIFDVHEK